uniref:THAP-type domain-containing protein n=1 Tax=Phlebotomus papatasi TaxID=29031 RepID=A0A1B0DJ98_PHLPP
MQVESQVVSGSDIDNEPEPEIEWLLDPYSDEIVEECSMETDFQITPIGAEHQSANDHSDAIIKKLNDDIKKLQEKVEILKRKNHALTMQVRRRDEKITKMESLSSSKDKTTPNICERCKTSFSLESLNGIIRLIVERILERGQKEFFNEKYEEELKFFAVQLHFISPKAYRFVRNELENALPSEFTILRWLKVIDCEPGFSDEALTSIHNYVASQNRLVWCQLLFDEMYIHRHIDIVAGKVYGFAFLGNAYEGNEESITDDSGDGEATATQVLVFMLVSVDMNWKLPIGYFPINKLAAPEKSKLITEAISLSEKAGVKVLGLTFDGAPVNFSSMKKLGCDLATVDEDFYTISLAVGCGMREIFVHPDPCHMLKLVRTHFANNQLVDRDGAKIDFKYVRLLHEFQQNNGAGIRLKGNKLTSNHVEFSQNSMSVELAAQVLSESVAEAIDHCRDVLQLVEFAGSEATTKFLRICNTSFDVLNTHKSTHKGYKAPIVDENCEAITHFCETAVSYFTDLQVEVYDKGRGTSKLQPISKSQVKTGFIGLRACLRNLPAMNVKMKHFCPEGFLTYPLLQDHLEFFFGEVRSKLGCNTNPTVMQFRAILKRLVTCVQMGQLLENTNCKAQGGVVPTLNVKSVMKVERNGHSEPKDVDVEPIPEPSDEDVFGDEVFAVHLTADMLMAKVRLDCEVCVTICETNSLFVTKLLEDVCTFGNNYFCQRVKQIGRTQFLKTYKEDACVTYIMTSFKNYPTKQNLMHFIEQNTHFLIFLEPAAKMFTEKRMREELRFFNFKISE